MQAIIGGAYNGKRKYVRDMLQHIDEKYIYSFDGEIPETPFSKKDYVIIGSFEKIIKNLLHLEELEIATVIIKKLDKLDSTTNLFCICTDIGRGIVPLSPEERKIRDACGRIYQQLFKQCDKVTRVWYGIPEMLKGDEL